MIEEKNLLLIIPNNEIGGAQNFFKRLFKNIPCSKKTFYVEDLDSFGPFNIFYRTWNINKNIRKLRSEGMVTIFATVNSIVPSALCKLLFTNFCLVSRLGNTLSAESKNQGIKSFKILLIHKIVFYLSDLVVFQSKSMKEDAVKVLNLKDSSKFIVINNGIDFTEVSLKSNHENLVGINKDYFNFILLGSFKYQKAYDVFLEAISLIPKEKINRMRFYICGDNAYGDNVFEEFKLGLEMNELNQFVYLMGWQENPYPLMKKMDAYILPSRYEGFPNSLIEALSLGLPSIASRSPGANEEIMLNGLNGLTFENESASDLRNQIISMQENRSSFDSLEIIADIKERYHIEKIANQYVEALK
jgi:glycosyltransferase involved in cell wall biosynthesis